MKTFLTVLLLLLLATSLEAANVRGHWRDTDRDGIKDTWVEPYQRTNPNSSRLDNYSYPGNFNPNTSQQTPFSNSPRELYPSNPSPYERSNDNPFLINR